MTHDDTVISVTPQQLKTLIAQALEPIWESLAVLQRQQADLLAQQQGQQIGWDVGKRMLEEQAKAKSQTDDNGNGTVHTIPASKGKRRY